MCGRYALELALEHTQYLAGVQLTEPIANYNVAPTHTVPILVDRLFGDETLEVMPGSTASFAPHASPDAAPSAPAQGRFVREMHAARWGLLPGWAKDPSFASRAFNARSETIFTKPTFREAAVAGHCAVPVSGYYEWKTETTAAGKTAKTPYFVHRADGRPIYFAGLYEWWKIPEEFAGPGSGFEGQGGQWLLSCSIITMDSPGNGEFDSGILADLGGEAPYANQIEEQLGQLHNRLPIPLSVADDRDVSESDSLTFWLRSGRAAGTRKPADAASKLHQRQSAEAALAHLREQAFAQTAGWAMHPVCKDVGNVSNNAPYLIEPAEDLLTGL